jgi:hypothetical protein
MSASPLASDRGDRENRRSMQPLRFAKRDLGLALGILVAAGCGETTPESPLVPSGDASQVVEALREPDPLARAESLARTFQQLPPEALPAVRDAYSGTFFDLGDTELVLLAEWWARFDAPAALEWSREEWRADTSQVRQSILRAWARRDPEAALRVAETQRAEGERALWLDAVLSGWEESGQPGAFELVRGMPTGADRQRALATLARRKVLRDGVAAAFDWAEALPEDDDRFKLNLMRRVGSAAAQLEPELAAERAGRLADGPYADGLLRHVGTRWAKRDGQAALRWLVSLPPGPPRDDGVSETYRSWLRGTTRADALRFMEGPARDDPALDPATALYAQVLASDDPLAAIEVARGLVDEPLRWATVGRVWRTWWIDDDEAANAWFEQASDIPEFYRERIPVIPQALRKVKRDKARAASQQAGSP